MKVIFVGTAEFGVPALERLSLSDLHEVIAVFTQPDRRSGRGQQLRPSPIKQVADGLGLVVHQPKKISDAGSVSVLQEFEPEAIVVAAYGQILSSQVLDVPRWPINIHASLLSRYRGAAPIQWAIINGETRTGVTTFLMDEGLDTGDILLQREVQICKDDAAGTVHDRLAQLGGELIVETLSGLERGTLEPHPQPGDRESYAPKLKPEDGQIDWDKSAQQIHNLIRGLNPYPGAYTFLDKLRLKVHRSHLVENDRHPQAYHNAEPGEVIAFAEAGFVVRTGDGALELLEVQPASRDRMGGMDFQRGYGLAFGDRLGSASGV
ncbi:MAG: methionyl-tRNA formyltransferase [Candidatus Bipolaricaulia bacterium]